MRTSCLEFRSYCETDAAWRAAVFNDWGLAIVMGDLGSHKDEKNERTR